MVWITRKLKLLKGALKKWNKDVFGRVEMELKRLEDHIIGLEENVASNFSSQVEADLLKCKQEHLEWVHCEEILACQKSRVKWIAAGDSNTSFFHATMRIKKKNKKIERMSLLDGSFLNTADEVHAGAVDFYKKMLSVSPVTRDLGLVCFHR